MTVLEEAKAHLEATKAHTDCCGTPMVKKLVAELDRISGHTLALTMIAEATFHDDKTVEALAWCQDLARTMLK